MKKFAIVFMCLALSMLLLSGCSCDRGAADPTEETEFVTEATEEVTEEATEVEVELLPIEKSLDMIFSSGAGAWESHITLKNDGSFTGGYHDMNAGESGEGYESTVYESSFNGRFTNIKQISDYAYSMILESVETENEPETEKIEDWDGVKVRVVSVDAYGIADGEEFIFYLPEAPRSEMNSDFLYWCMGSRSEDIETLERYGLYNVAGATGFFTYD